MNVLLPKVVVVRRAAFHEFQRDSLLLEKGFFAGQTLIKSE